MRLVRVPVLLLLFALAGCTTTKLVGNLPKITDSSRTAEVYVIRKNVMSGRIRTATVAVNGKDVLTLKSGQYTRFRVPADEYNREVSVGTRVPLDVVVWDQVNLLCDPGATYYILIDASNRKSFVTRLSPEEAQERIAESEYVAVEGPRP